MLGFCKKYRYWTAAEWRKVMFSDESTLRLVRGVPKMVRRPSIASRFDRKFTVKPVKHPASIMVWDAFSENMGRAGLYFLKMLLWKDAIISTFEKIICSHSEGFISVTISCMMGPQHISQNLSQNFWQSTISKVLEWLGNSSELNPIENAWNYLKNKLQKTRPSNIDDLQKELKKLWGTMYSSYFAFLADSMPKRFQMVIDCKGERTKYWTTEDFNVINKISCVIFSFGFFYIDI